MRKLPRPTLQERQKKKKAHFVVLISLLKKNLLSLKFKESIKFI